LARLLILSSWVAAGHVGLSAAMPALQALGHRVIALPTVVLSNHPGFAHAAGAALPLAQLAKMIDALDANGWLDEIDAVLTGYMPSADHVAQAATLIADLQSRSSTPKVVVDPVIGDLPKGLYVPETVADAIRDRLLPLADILTPNRFELSWLAGAPADTAAEARSEAMRLLRDGPRAVVTTSAFEANGRLGTMHVAPGIAQTWSVPHRTGVPHGVGDVFSALLSAGLPIGAALGRLDVLIAESLGAPHLRIAESAAQWTGARPLREI
jgi:pyridoxine kinase